MAKVRNLLSKYARFTGGRKERGTDYLYKYFFLQTELKSGSVAVFGPQEKGIKVLHLDHLGDSFR